MIREFINPLAGLKLFPSRIFKFLIICVDGRREIACCCISVVDLVAFMIMIQKGIILMIASRIHTT